MSEKSSSKKATKSKKPARKTAAKKSVAKKAAARKTTAKKAAARKSPAKKTTTAKKATAKKATAKKATRKKAGKIRVSEMMKRASHTPAIFKTGNRRSGHIVFTLEDVRELLKERAKEESSSAAAKKKAETTPAKKAVPSPQPDQTAAERAAESPSRHAAASLDDILGLSPTSAVPNAKGPRSVPRKFRKYYSLLVELRDQVRQELNLHSNDTLKRSQKEDAGDISISVDAGTDNFDRDFALSLLSSEQEALNEIEAAIERIYEGSYGICQVTGKPIAPERLEAVPFTRFSLEGQRQHESTTHRRVDRQGTFLNDDSGEAIGFGDEDGDN
jgi:RNA polymerase-binding transcription factor DksA